MHQVTNTTKPRKMNKTNFNLLLPIILLLFNSSPTAHSKSVIEPCNSSDSCPSLLSYNLPFDSKLSEIAYKFNLNITHILSSNSLDPSTPPSQIIPSKTLIKILISCPCIDGIRRSLSTFYTVRPSDTVDSISEGYGRLVSGEQIESVNGVSEERPLMSGDRIVIELPCTCFGNENDEGVSAVYLSYVVQSGDSLSGIGGVYGTTVGELQEINGLEQAHVDPGDVLAIPIPACSSMNLNLYNESLIVPNGSYALTANNCVKCTCGPFDLNLQCMPSGIMVSCSHLHCKGSNLYIGDSSENQTPFGCNITQCIYRGHSGHKIFRSLAKSSHPQCSGNNSGAVGSPLSLPSPTDYGVVPFSILSPSPSPSPFASYGPEGTDGPNPTRRQSGNSHRVEEGWLTIHTSFLAFFLLVFAGSVFF